MDYTNIIKLCRRARRAKEISQAEVAFESHIAQSRISQFENGYYSPSIAAWYYDNILSESDRVEIEKIGSIWNI